MKLTGNFLVLAALVTGTALGAVAPAFAQQQMRDGSGAMSAPMMNGSGGRGMPGMMDSHLPGFEMSAGPQNMIAQLDADGDGTVTTAEFTAARTAAVEGLDADGDGKLSADELVAKEIKDFEARAKARVAARIAAQDIDGDGMLSAAELATRVVPLAMFDRFDANNDGVIASDEMRAMRQMMQRNPDRMGGMGGHDHRGRDDDGRGGRHGKGYGGHYDGQMGQQGRMQHGQQMGNGWMPFFQRNAPQGN